TPLPNAEAVIGSLDEFLALPRDGKWAENSSLARRTRVIQNPIADFGSQTKAIAANHENALIRAFMPPCFKAPTHPPSARQ
ncbi:MAG TPA: hypothetical protein VII24_09800, partial [Pseudolabrys sp.]